MRWFWIDRFVQFERGKRATAIKNVNLAEEPLDDYFPSSPFLPHSLIIEGTAQTGGLLVSEEGSFNQRVVLAKVSKAIFHRFAEAGDQIHIHVEVAEKLDRGAIITGKSMIGSELQGEFELWFAFLDDSFGKERLFPPELLMRWLRVLRLYDIAVDEQGNRLSPPEYLLEAERLAGEPGKG